MVRGVDKKNITKMGLVHDKQIHDLKPKIVKFRNRFQGWDGRTNALISDDGSDF